MLRDIIVDQDEAHARNDPAVPFAHSSSLGREGDGLLQEARIDGGSSANEVCDVDRDVDESIRADSCEATWVSKFR